MVLRHELIDLSDKLMFPGLVFVFVWDVLAHWRRIMACPGVQSIMVDGNEKPVIVPDDGDRHISGAAVRARHCQTETAQALRLGRRSHRDLNRQVTGMLTVRSETGY